jgi:hypothetical protein
MAAVVPSLKTMSTAERRKVYVLAVLLVVLVAAGAYSFLGSGSSQTADQSSGSKPAAKPGDTSDPNTVASVSSDSSSAEPLDFRRLVVPVVGDAVARNPFAFPPKPPPPPGRPKPPDPVATIIIGNITPNSVVAGVPRPIDVTVTGRNFQPDFKVTWNGRLLRTQRLSTDQLRVTLTPAEIASAGTVRVNIVSESQQSKLWSETRTFEIREAPRPSFQYIGRVGDLALIDFGGTGNQKTAHVGDMIGQPAIWKVVAITPEKVDLLDTRNEIPRSIALNRKDR